MLYGSARNRAAPGARNVRDRNNADRIDPSPNAATTNPAQLSFFPNTSCANDGPSVTTGSAAIDTAATPNNITRNRGFRHAIDATSRIEPPRPSGRGALSSRSIDSATISATNESEFSANTHPNPTAAIVTVARTGPITRPRL